MEPQGDPAIHEKEALATQHPNDQGKDAHHHADIADICQSLGEAETMLRRLARAIDHLNAKSTSLERVIIRNERARSNWKIRQLQNELAALERKHKWFVKNGTKAHNDLVKEIRDLEVNIEEAETLASERQTMLMSCERNLEESGRKEKELEESLEGWKKWQAEQLGRAAYLATELASAQLRANLFVKVVYVLLVLVFFLIITR